VIKLDKEIFTLLKKEIDNLQSAGLFHDEYVTEEKRKGKINIDGRELIDFTSNDFLDLNNNKEIISAAKKAMDEYGVATGSYRYIAGTGGIHTQLEDSISKFLKKESTAIFSTLYQANLGLLESLVNHQDHIFANIKCHPSIIDGVQSTTSAKSYFGAGDLSDLEDQLKRSPQARFRFIITEGVASNDGGLTDLNKICDLADTYDDIVILHDSNGIGLTGDTGMGSAEATNTLERIDIITAGFSRALSGVEIGFVTGKLDYIRWIKQKSNPYVFSSSPSPVLVASAQRALEILIEKPNLTQSLVKKSMEFRSKLSGLGYRLIKNDHPIVGVITNDAVKTQKMVDKLFELGVFVTGLCYPVVPKGFSRIRCHVTLSHTYEQIDQAIGAFEKVASEFLGKSK